MRGGGGVGLCEDGVTEGAKLNRPSHLEIKKVLANHISRD